MVVNQLATKNIIPNVSGYQVNSIGLCNVPQQHKLFTIRLQGSTLIDPEIKLGMPYAIVTEKTKIIGKYYSHQQQQQQHNTFIIEFGKVKMIASRRSRSRWLVRNRLIVY